MLARLCLTPSDLRNYPENLPNLDDTTGINVAALLSYKENDWIALAKFCDHVEDRSEITFLYDIAKIVALDPEENEETRQSAYFFLRSQDQYIEISVFFLKILPLCTPATWAVFFSDPAFPDTWTQALHERLKAIPSMIDFVFNMNGSNEFDLFFLHKKLTLITTQFNALFGFSAEDEAILYKRKKGAIESAVNFLKTFKANDLFNVYIVPSLLEHPHYFYDVLSFYAQTSEAFKQSSSVKAFIQLHYFFHPEEFADKLDADITDIMINHDSATFFKLLMFRYLDDLNKITEESAQLLHEKITQQLPGEQILAIHDDIRFVRYSLSCKISSNTAAQQNSMVKAAGRSVVSLFNKRKPVGKDVKTPFITWILNNLENLNNHVDTGNFSESMIWKAYMECYLPIKHPGQTEESLNDLISLSQNYPKDTQKDKVNKWLGFVFESNITSETVNTLAPLPEKILHTLFDGTNVAIELFAKNNTNNKIAVARKHLSTNTKSGLFQENLTNTSTAGSTKISLNRHTT